LGEEKKKKSQGLKKVFSPCGRKGLFSSFCDHSSADRKLGFSYRGKKTRTYLTAAGRKGFSSRCGLITQFYRPQKKATAERELQHREKK